MLIIPSYTYYGMCTRVIDGDTIELTVDLGFQIAHVIHVRLVAVYADEIFSGSTDEKSKGMLAKQYMESLILNKRVICMTIKDSMNFNRYLANIFIEDISGNTVHVNEIAQKYYVDNGLTNIK